MIGLLLGIAIGILLTLRLKNKVNFSVIMDCVAFWIQRLWYSLILLLGSIYVCCNYEDCISLSFTSDFNGKNLVFLFWLLLLIFPFFESFEGFGIKFKNMMHARQMSKEFEAQKKVQEEIEQIKDNSHD